MKKERILVIEDDFVFGIAALSAFPESEDTLVVGELEEGLQQINKFKPTIALLDVNIEGGESFPIGKQLEKLNIPLLYVTGVDAVNSTGHTLGIEEIAIKDKNINTIKTMKKTEKDMEVWQTAYKILRGK